VEVTAWLLSAILLASPGDGWSNLKHVTRERLYAVMLRDGGCEYGVISSVGEQGLVLGRDSALGIAILRSRIARVSDNLTAPGRDAVFSARSSWLDVKGVELKGNEYLRVVTKRGEEWKWKRAEVSDDAINFIGKADVRYVFHVRSKSLTIDGEYFHQQEDFKWLPWIGELVPGRISVLLNNSDVVEDDARLACR
jgi:hypothetical protein